MLYGSNTFLAGGRFTGRIASLSTGGGTTVPVTIMLVVVDRGRRRRGFVRFALVAVLVAILLLASVTVATVSVTGAIVETTVASAPGADVVVFDLILGDFKFERIGRRWWLVRRSACWPRWSGSAAVCRRRGARGSSSTAERRGTG